MRITAQFLRESHARPARSHAALEWIPLLILTALPIAASRWLEDWALMWTLAGAIFMGFKWATWYRAVTGGVETTPLLSAAYLLAWPGMDARQFLQQELPVPSPSLNQWALASAKTLLGVVLVWEAARLSPSELLAGWIGMVGTILILHFGLFHLLALFFQTTGVNARPLMDAPLLSSSVSDFWGRRWNAGFRDIAFGLAFRPLSREFGSAKAMLLTFFLSGVVHDLVITLPAGGDYGLPTLYFTIQGCALLFERTAFARKTILRGPFMRRVFALAMVAVPVGLLFPPRFVLEVFVPFLRVIKALP